MAYEARTFQSITANTPPTGTDPLVDNTASGDVQAIKLLDPTAGSTTPLIGQKARTGSTPVALSSEDAALLVDLLTNTVFQARIPTNGQKAMAGSVPVVIASDQSAVPVSAASLPLPPGAATAARQDTGNTSLSNLETKIGEVQASPTANTVLDRLKQLLTGISLAASTNAIGKLAANSGVDIGDVDVTSISAGENHLGEVGGNSATITVSVTRPSDTTAYAANDELSDSTSSPAVITFTSIARASGGGGYITDAVLADSANQSTKGQFELWLFDTTTTPGNDNAAFAPSDGVTETLIGILPFNVWYPGDDTSGASGNAISVYSGPPISFKTSGSANLFGRIKVKNAYTPVSAEKLTFRLKARRD